MGGQLSPATQLLERRGTQQPRSSQAAEGSLLPQGRAVPHGPSVTFKAVPDVWGMSQEANVAVYVTVYPKKGRQSPLL